MRRSTLDKRLNNLLITTSRKSTTNNPAKDSTQDASWISIISRLRRLDLSFNQILNPYLIEESTNLRHTEDYIDDFAQKKHRVHNSGW